jgi:hypothetical protein
MAYRITFTPRAEATRKSLPMNGKLALRVKPAAIAMDPTHFGRQCGPTVHHRACPFGRKNEGLIFYIDDLAREIKIQEIIWAK